MLINIVIFVLFLSGCVAIQGKAELVDSRDGKLTLKYFVGEVPTWYDSAFENKAVELCGNTKFDVLEKSYTPSTLTVFDDKYYYYWVVKCK